MVITIVTHVIVFIAGMIVGRLIELRIQRIRITNNVINAFNDAVNKFNEGEDNESQ